MARPARFERTTFGFGMRKRITALLFVAALGCLPLANPINPGGAATAPSNTGRNLGVLPGDTYSVGFGVSAIGSVVGGSAYSTSRGAVTHPFYWDRSTGVMLQLPTSGTTSEGSGHAVEIAGKTKTSEFAVGSEDLPTTLTRAVIWVAPSLQAVPIVLDSGATVVSQALGVNEVGTAVGMRGDETAICMVELLEDMDLGRSSERSRPRTIGASVRTRPE